MKLCGALALLIGTISTVHGLRCFTCTAAEPKSCTDTKSCPVIFNRCYSLKLDGFDHVTKGCQTSVACIGGAMACCEGDLCNHGMKHAGPSAVLLLLLATAAVLFSSV